MKCLHMPRSLVILDSMNQFTSVFLLTVMSVDRYLSLSRPLTGIQFRTKQYAWILSGTAWILAALVCCPLWFASQSFEGKRRKLVKDYQNKDLPKSHLLKRNPHFQKLPNFFIPSYYFPQY